MNARARSEVASRSFRAIESIAWQERDDYSITVPSAVSQWMLPSGTSSDRRTSFCRRRIDSAGTRETSTVSITSLSMLSVSLCSGRLGGSPSSADVVVARRISGRIGCFASAQLRRCWCRIRACSALPAPEHQDINSGRKTELAGACQPIHGEWHHHLSLV